MPMFENADKLQSIADRFGVYLGIVQNIVQSGLDRDLSLEACLVGARLALSMESGKEELFSLDDIAAVLGCSREEAATELEKQGIQGAQISTLPGFEWLLGQMLPPPFSSWKVLKMQESANIKKDGPGGLQKTTV